MPYPDDGVRLFCGFSGFRAGPAPGYEPGFYSFSDAASGNRGSSELRAFARGGCGPSAFGRPSAEKLPLPARAKGTKPETSTVAPPFSGCTPYFLLLLSTRRVVRAAASGGGGP